MAKNFITNNESHKSLNGRLKTLISISDELKFLVGFFYFSGWKEVYEQLKAHEGGQLKLLADLVPIIITIRCRIFDEIKWIRNQFGADYLDKILKRVENQKSEVIIAVENHVN